MGLRSRSEALPQRAAYNPHPGECLTAIEIGTRLGPYEILGSLGAGGMGEVYRAKDTRLRREVALKVVPTSLAESPDALARFEREAQTLAALSHPNLVAVFDVGREHGTRYLVMELLPGETLRRRLGTGPLPLRTTLDYARQITHGLAAAHGKGIVHRDLKPENLFITRDGVVKILDFGLAKRAERTGSQDLSTSPTSTHQTVPGTVLGSTGYMSPEQVRGLPADHRSDIFSFGAILYEMVGGRRAFAADSSADIMSAILKDEPPELGIHASAPALDKLIWRCLAKNPLDRFQSASDLTFVLDAVAEPSGTTLPRPAPDPHTASIAVLPFTNMSPDPDTEYFSDGITEEIINALSQLPGVLVAARTSSFAFKGKNQDLRLIASKLNVSNVLEGSVRRAGSKLRITAQLIRAGDGNHIWSERYDRELADVFAIQDEIAQALAERLKVTFAREPGSQAAPLARDHEAYDLYLRGRYFFNRRSAPQAIAAFEQAIARDASFAPAYTGLADSYGIHAFYGGIDTRVAYARARTAAERARQLAPESAEVNVSMGILEHYFGWNFEKEEQELSAALKRAPRVAAAYYWMSLLHGLRGRLEEALPFAREAARLDPLSSHAVSVGGWALFATRRFEAARVEFRKGLEIDPNGILQLWGLSMCEHAIGDAAEAVAAAEKVAAITERRTSYGLGTLALAYASAGRKEDARRILAELGDRATREYVAPIHLAPVLVYLEDWDAAFRAFEQACEERNALAWWWVLYDPSLEALRKDPRFAALAARAAKVA